MPQLYAAHFLVGTTGPVFHKDSSPFVDTVAMKLPLSARHEEVPDEWSNAP
jgi:hypothetical protein